MKLQKKIQQSLFNSFKKSEIQKYELNYLFWECTLRCNLKCLHCGSDCKQDASVKDMPAKDFLSVLIQIRNRYPKQKRMVAITGGEPLLRKDLEDIGREIRKLGFGWGIVTNGMALTEKRLNSLIAAGMGSLTLSLDGFADAHNWMRGNPRSFEKAHLAIEILVKQNRLNYDIVTCVNQKNINELDAIAVHFSELDVRAWRLFTIAPIGRAKLYPELFLTPKQHTLLMKFIKNARKKYPFKVQLSCEAFVGDYEREVRDSFFFCRAGINIASILADGSISACPNIDHSFVQGNIYTDNFIDVWENRFTEMRNRNWTDKDECATCTSYENCQGNGLHWWSGREGNLLKCHNALIINK